MDATWPVSVDLSDYQAPPDWHAVKAAGVAGAWRKACQGSALQRRYATDLADAIGAGVPFGAYYFPTFALTRNGAAEADTFLRLTNGLSGTTLPPMLDVEDDPGYPTMAATLGPNGAADVVLAWVTRVEAETGRTPVVYLNPNVAPFGAWSPDPALAACPLWVPHYGTRQDYATAHGPDYVPTWSPRSTRPWSAVDAHQHSGDNGRCPGFSGAVDLSRWNPDTWRRLGAPAPQEDDDMPRYTEWTDEDRRQFLGDVLRAVSGWSTAEGQEFTHAPDGTRYVTLSDLAAKTDVDRLAWGFLAGQVKAVQAITDAIVAHQAAPGADPAAIKAAVTAGLSAALEQVRVQITTTPAPAPAG